MNARKEIEKFVDKLECAKILYNESYINENFPEYKGSYYEKILDLPIGYSDKQLEDFLNELDFEYDNGFGGQELFGILWLTDGTWVVRGEYDGSEWWEHITKPVIPNELRINEL